MKGKRILLKAAMGVLAGAALFSTTLAASPRAKTPAATVSAVISSDQQLADRVSSALRRYPYNTVFDWVTGDVHNGVVTLNGAVHIPGRQNDYARLAAKVPGVARVVNNLRVLPASPFDDDLRIAAARAIYRNSNFTDLAIQPNPPVHIIVDHGKIELQGIVTNAMERQLAEMDVRSRTMAFEVVNHLQVES